MRHLILMTVFASGTLLADPVLKFDTSTPNRTNYENEIVGWEFNVLKTIDVTGLGWYDEAPAGLFLAHTVGIYNSSGNLLASTTVLAGALDPLVGLFRTADISKLVLSPGTYIVAGQEFAPTDIPATNITDQPAWGVAPSILDSRIAFVGGEFFSTADNKFESTATNCCWGPSFSDAAANVPEPSGVSALLAAGLLAMLVARRTRRT